MFGYTPEELGKLSDAELNQRMDFVRLAMPSEWLEYADELMEAAEILWNNRDNKMITRTVVWDEDVDGEIKRCKKTFKYKSISRTYVFLAGLALENLIKGILVARDPTHINTSKLSKKLQSHMIYQLIVNIGDIDLDDGEKDFCKVAETAIPYWGRYPIPLKYKNIVPEERLDDKLRDSFLRLYERLAQDLHDFIKDGWDSGVGAKHIKSRNASRGDKIDPSEL